MPVRRPFQADRDGLERPSYGPLGRQRHVGGHDGPVGQIPEFAVLGMPAGNVQWEQLLGHLKSLIHQQQLRPGAVRLSTGTQELTAVGTPRQRRDKGLLVRLELDVPTVAVSPPSQGHAVMDHFGQAARREIVVPRDSPGSGATTAAGRPCGPRRNPATAAGSSDLADPTGKRPPSPRKRLAEP